MAFKAELCCETIRKMFDGIFYNKVYTFDPQCKHDCIILLLLSVSSRTWVGVYVMSSFQVVVYIITRFVLFLIVLNRKPSF